MRQSTRSDTDLRQHLAVMRGYRLPGWLRAAVDPDLLVAALCGHIAELVPGALALQRVIVDDARASRRRWTLRYSADVATVNGVRQVQLIAALWPPGTALPADTGGVLLPELRMTIRALSADPGLPALPSLTEPDSARALLEQALRSHTGADLRLVAVRPRLARHKPGNRATLVCELTYPPGADPAWPRTVVAKTYRGDEGAGTYAAMQALWQSRIGGRNGARVAEPLAYLPDSRTLLQGQVPGDRTLADVLLRPAAAADQEDSSLAAALRDTADGLAALHACDVRVGPTRDVATELAASRRLLARVAPSLALRHGASRRRTAGRVGPPSGAARRDASRARCTARSGRLRCSWTVGAQASSTSTASGSARRLLTSAGSSPASANSG